MAKKNGKLAKQEGVHPGELANSGALSEEMMQQFDEDGKENLDNISDTFHRISTQGGRYKVDGQLIGGDGTKFEGVVVREVPVNVYYAAKYDPDNPTPPDCWSLGGVTPQQDSPNKQVDIPHTCAECPKNRFGSGTGADGGPGKGKACANTRRLVLSVSGVDLPVLLTLPPTSIKGFNKYLKHLSSFTPRVPMFAITTVFGFDTTVSYARPVMSSGKYLAPDEYARIKEERTGQVIENALNAYAVGADVQHNGEEKEF